MQLAANLKALGVNSFPCAVSYDSAKLKWKKQPLTVRGEPWGVTATRPLNDPDVNWQNIEVLGVPIPRGIVVLDLDVYKPGVTIESAAMMLGGEMPWAAALIQTTISGGHHYAFRAPEWLVKQGNDLCGPGSGVDTRIAEKGFICSGGGYSPGADGMGVLRLAYPESLPELPEHCRPILERIIIEAPTSNELPVGNRDIDAIVAALGHIDPSERDTWRDTGFALKHHFHDDEATGFAIWDDWSQGVMWADGCPSAYDAEAQPSQWGSFKAVKEGASITIGSLFHNAVLGGWKPPAKFDTSIAFGAGAAPMDLFKGLLQWITEEGANPLSTEEIIEAIRLGGFNDVQTILLRNELKAILKSAKLLDKSLSNAIDGRTTPEHTTIASGQYGKNHTENAQLFIQANYQNDTLIRADEVWFGYTGKCWAEIEDGAMDHQLTMSMLPSFPQKSTVNGTYQMAASMMHRAGVKMQESPPGLIVFQNGVLDVFSGVLMPHDTKYLTAKIVPYNYNPNATAPTWDTFVNQIFEGDQERIALLQEWMGYMMSPSYDYQKVMLMLGPRRSGKGTIGNIIAELVGDLNHTGCSLASFAADDFLDSLQHKTVAFSGDTAKNINRNIIDKVIENIKKISGNDAVDFARKYKSRLTCRLPTRITLASNHIPKLFDDSEALMGRLLVLPMDVSFYNREDPQLLGKLLAEMEGIALWSLQGLARLNTQNKFTIPAASLSEMQFIADSYSPLRAFIDMGCELGTDNTVSTADLYDAYRAWAVGNAEDHILTRRTFVSAFKDVTRGRGCRYGTKRVGADIFKGFEGVTLTAMEPATAGAFKPQMVKKL